MNRFLVSLEVQSAGGIVAQLGGATTSAILTFKPGNVFDVEVASPLKLANGRLIKSINGTPFLGRKRTDLTYAATRLADGSIFISTAFDKKGATFHGTAILKGSKLLDVQLSATHAFGSLAASGAGVFVSGASTPPPVVADYRPRFWYGAVNNVPEMPRSLQVEYAHALATAKIGGLIEYTARGTDRAHYRKAEPFFSECNRLRVPVQAYFCNTNDDETGKMPLAWRIGCQGDLIGFLDPSKDRILACNETDADLSASMRRACTKHLQENWAGALVSYGEHDPHSRVRIYERHPQTPTDFKRVSGRQTIFVYDNHQMIQWLSSGPSDSQNFDQSKIRKAGNNFKASAQAGDEQGFYGFMHKRPDFAGIKAIGELNDAVIVPVPQAGAYATTIEADGDKFIKWSPFIPWKNARGQNVSAEIVLNGVRIEYIRENYRRQKVNNAYGSGSRGVPGIKKGELQNIYFDRLDSDERTPTVRFMWPWVPTR